MTIRSAKFAVDSEQYVVISYPSVPLSAELSPAERAVVELLLSGASYQRIADVRRRSVRTVAKQIASAFKKLGVSSRAELAALTVTSRRSH
jgi:DNA-binding CsgD family transcriptional regulator